MRALRGLSGPLPWEEVRTALAERGRLAEADIVELAERLAMPPVQVRAAAASFADLVEPAAGPRVCRGNALARTVLDAGAEDRAYLAERCEGAGELATFLATQDLESAARASGVPIERIRAAGRRRPGWTRPLRPRSRVSELTQATESVMALANLPC